jgi:coproporphyrinogen III oxidase-like Fe-S oxidoreductase
LISQIAGYITRREGQKFLQLNESFDDRRIDLKMLRPGEELSLYIHIPFCRRLCPFCCFNRYLYNEEKAIEYFQSLRRELDMYLERGFHFSSIYFGGGTPTLQMPELLGFMDYLDRRTGVKDISLETTPGELNPENVAALKSAGIKRLSIGVQSFQDEMLKAMGRLVCPADEIEGRLLLAQGQFKTLNIDLIFNFPFQTLEAFRQDIAIFKRLGIDQVTFYPLMPSPHKKNALERRFSRVDNSREKQYYDIILEEVAARGFNASTVWCFSRGDLMIDEYIVDYADYIGIGSGSVSLVNGNFYVNSFSLERYAEKIRLGQFPIARWRQLSEAEYLHYYLLTKLFGICVSKAQFSSQFGKDIQAKLGWEIALLKLIGALKEDQSEIKVTERGMYTVSVMMREFFAALNTLREEAIENQI